MLRNLEKVCKAPLHELFDYVCGVSTGSLLAVMVAVFNVQLDECERVYKEFSRQMFSRNIVMGASTLLMSHAFYDASIWEKILVYVCLYLGFNSSLFTLVDSKTVYV